MHPNPEQRLLVMMAGTMGSGKSTFSRKLASKVNARHINADVIRRELFGTYEEWTKPANKDKVFENLNHQVRQHLRAGHSVIRDYQHDYRRDRDKARAMAEEAGALAIIAWMKIPKEVAIRRSLDRPESPDSIRFDEAFVKDAVRRHLDRLEPPEPDELYVEIDSLLPFDEQYKTFADFCSFSKF